MIAAYRAKRDRRTERTGFEEEDEEALRALGYIE
jgi:hypothetical protein